MSASIASIELEAINAASMEFTQKIERERSRNHTLIEKSRKLKEAIQERRAELLESRRCKARAKPSSKERLQARLASLRTKSDEQSSRNVKLREVINNFRVERLQSTRRNNKSKDLLELSKARYADLQQELHNANQELKNVSNQLETLKVATLEEIEADQAEINSLSYQVLPEKQLNCHACKSMTPRLPTPVSPSASDCPPVPSVDVHDALESSQAIVKQRADDLARLYEDREAVIDAMSAIHALREECGIGDDNELIAAFEMAEEENYDDCQEINGMLGDLAVVEKDRVLLEEMLVQETSQPPRDDGPVNACNKNVHDILEATRNYEERARRDEESVEACTRLVLNVLRTLTSRTKTQTDETLGLASKPLTEMLAFIENAVDTFVHFSKEASIPEISHPCRSCLPPIKCATKNTDATTSLAPSSTRARRLSSVSGGQQHHAQRHPPGFYIQYGSAPRPAALPWASEGDDDNEDDAGNPQSLEDLRLKTKLRLESPGSLLGLASTLPPGSRRVSKAT